MKDFDKNLNINEIFEESACDDARGGWGRPSQCGKVEIDCNTVNIYITCGR
ncbi:hypothetical protein CLOACE_15300 [Clostridium acetireducens DSM 10703]|uniref:Uncharacterized protein n=1 Tax=Clostridium acetireducens DSM 10703 TaxID=1121290 RepID=A0A1E8EY23_9CLOT|nr:hypothetical protein [Clostridium acetireducens]OFI05835.1 hypothetical protein CLOACE_15300 [Clostridium acetireducens DSM 10703]